MNTQPLSFSKNVFGDEMLERKFERNKMQHD